MRNILLEADPSDDIPEERIILQIIVIPVLYLYLLLGVWVRIWENYGTAYQKFPYHSKKLMIRITLNSLLIAIYSTTIIFSYSSDTFWLSKRKGLAWVYLVVIFAIAGEIRAIMFHYYRRLVLSKKVHLVSWSLIFIAETFIIIFYEISSREGILGIIYDATKGGLLLARVIIQVRYPQDRDEFDDPRNLDDEYSYSNSIDFRNEKATPFLNRRSTDFDKVERRFTPGARQGKKLDLSMQISNKVKQKFDPKLQRIETYYQIEVKTFGKHYKVSRGLEEFRVLERDVNLSKSSSVVHASMMTQLDKPDSITSSVKVLQGFLDGFLQSKEAIPMCLVNFLDIPDSLRQKILTWNEKSLSLQHMDIAIDNAQDIVRQKAYSGSGFAELEYDQKGESDEENDLIEMTNDPSEEAMYCPYFDVIIHKWQKATYGDHYEYVISIALSENKNESWEIVKRYSEFVELNNKLFKEIGAKPPRLPAKKLITNDQTLRKRKNGLESFLKILLNEKIYLKTKAVQDFIQIKKELRGMIYGEDDGYDFSQLKAEIKDNRVSMRDEGKATTEYQITIIEWPFDSICATSERKVYRKFKDFENLHKALKTRFPKEKLPELPPKYNEFSSQTNVEVRMKGLEKYLNILFNIPKIGDSFVFRRFVSYHKKLGGLKETHTNELRETHGSGSFVEMSPNNSFKIDSLVTTMRARTKLADEM